MKSINTTKSHSFTQIKNRVILNSTLSCKAFKLLCIGLSRPYEWDYKKKEIKKSFKEGMHTVEEAMKELRNLGYLHMVSDQNNGIFNGWVWFWFDEPLSGEEFKKYYRNHGFRRDRVEDTPIPESTGDVGRHINKDCFINKEEEKEIFDDDARMREEDQELASPASNLPVDANPVFCHLQGLVGRHHAEHLWMQAVRAEYDMKNVVNHCLKHPEKVQDPVKLISAAIRDLSDYSDRPKTQNKSRGKRNEDPPIPTHHDDEYYEPVLLKMRSLSNPKIDSSTDIEDFKEAAKWEVSSQINTEKNDQELTDYWKEKVKGKTLYDIVNMPGRWVEDDHKPRRLKDGATVRKPEDSKIKKNKHKFIKRHISSFINTFSEKEVKQAVEWEFKYQTNTINKSLKELIKIWKYETDQP